MFINLIKPVISLSSARRRASFRVYVQLWQIQQRYHRAFNLHLSSPCRKLIYPQSFSWKREGICVGRIFLVNLEELKVFDVFLQSNCADEVGHWLVAISLNVIHPVVLEQGQGEAVTFILVFITIAIQLLEAMEMLYFFLFECIILAI